MAVDKAHFFATVRVSLFSGSLSETQVAALDAIIDSFAGPLDHMAYIMATAYHETATELGPVVENLNYTTAARIRKVWPSRFRTEAAAKPYVRSPEALANKVYGNRRDLGNDAEGDGWRYRGRGLAQITGKGRYAEFGKLMSIDLVGNPDLALKPAIAARILVVGMRDGKFTGKKLADYDGANGFDFVRGRAVVNGDVKANGELVAGHAIKFRAALRESTAATEPPVPVPPTDSTPVPVPSPTAKPRNLLIVVAGIIVAVATAIAKALGWIA